VKRPPRSTLARARATVVRLDWLDSTTYDTGTKISLPFLVDVERPLASQQEQAIYAMAIDLSHQQTLSFNSRFLIALISQIELVEIAQCSQTDQAGSEMSQEEGH